MKALALVTAWAIGMAGCGDPPRAAQEAPVVDGERTSAYPAVAALLNRRAGAICTATAIAPRWLLTAGHCLNKRLSDTEENLVRAWELDYHEGPRADPNDRGIAVDDLFLHPDFAGGAQFDLGLVRLERDTEGGTLPLSSDPPAHDEAITLLGYGVTGTHRADGGVKRLAHNRIDAIYPWVFTFEGTGDGEGNLCEGDSGGPSLADRGAGPVVIGVHSGRGSAGCGSVGYDMRVDALLDWIESVTELDLGVSTTEGAGAAGGAGGAGEAGGAGGAGGAG